MVNQIDADRRHAVVRIRRFLAVAIAGSLTVGGGSPNAKATTPDAKFVAAAEEMRRRALAAGDRSFGAVIVKDGRVVGTGPSRMNTHHDATAHAEMEAIRDASRRLARLGAGNLAGCVMYSTFRPCSMCETATYWADISQLYHGAGPVDGGSPRYGGC